MKFSVSIIPLEAAQL